MPSKHAEWYLRRSTKRKTGMDFSLRVSKNSEELNFLLWKENFLIYDLFFIFFYRNLVLCHKHALLDQLSKCDDPALTLHLAVLVIFTISTQCMLHASGKFVSSILSYLQPTLTTQQSSALTTFHDLVLKLLTATSSESEETKVFSEELFTKMGEIKTIASTFKKSGTSNVE